MQINPIIGRSTNIVATLLGTEKSEKITIEEANINVKTLEGNDTITGKIYLDNLTIDADEGDDEIIFSSNISSSTITLGPGNDYINMLDFSGFIYGGAGEDSITINSERSANNTQIRGDKGNDQFQLSNVANTIVNGNADNDIIDISGNTENSSVYGGQRDTITVLNATNTLIRGDDDDDMITINGNLDATIINGNTGNDHLSIAATSINSSTVYGGQGNDEFSIVGDAMFINGGKGKDTIRTSSNEKHSIYGGTGEDTIITNNGKTVFIDGGSEADRITLTGVATNSGAHTVDGGAGKDSLTGTTGKELLDGGTEDLGNDTIISNGGDDTIYGRAGDDLINLDAGINSGNVLIQAGAGNDNIILQLDKLTYLDTIKGEKGNDTIRIVGSSQDFNMWETNTIVEKSFDTISSIETIAFGGSDDNYRVSGTKSISLSSKVQSAGVSTIDVTKATGAGTLVINTFQFSSRTNLTLVGSEDKDVNVHFTGGSGHDTLTTGKTAEDRSDTLEGGLGVDTFNVIATDNITLIQDLGSGGNDALTIAATAAGMTATVTHNYTAPARTSNNKSTTNVILNANSGVNINMFDASGIFGYTINGGDEASTLEGSIFDDSISGNARADQIISHKGNDTITGHGGNDTIKLGDAGRDDIVFGTTASNGIDTISGFVSGNDDDDLNFIATVNGLAAESKPAFVNTTPDIADITGGGGANTAGEADDSVLVLNIANYQFANAASLVSGTTTGVGSGIAVGASKSAIVIYGSSSATGDSRVALASIADAGGITAAVDLAIIKGIGAAAANFNDTDFIFT